MGEEEYSVSATDSLIFAVDTVKFDTVIAGQSTPTQTFQAFNKGKKALRIARVALGKGKQSPFIVNVDGQWLNGGSNEAIDADFTILAEDSIRFFVALNAPTTDLDEPQDVEDVLEVTLENGRRQKVLMTAASQDVNILRALVVKENMTLNSKRPYQIMDSLVVAEGKTLTLKAGTRLYFHAGASLIVHGTLKAQGTLQKPVVMRGDRLGNMFMYQPYDRIPGQWGGVTFTSTSLGNDMTWCDIHSGTYGIRCEATESAKQKLIIDNSIIHNVNQDAFYAKMCNTFVGNCQITNAGENCVNLIGGSHTFVHCTIARFYYFVNGTDGVALRFTNTEEDTPMPLTQCQFFNCLITGSHDDEVMGEASERFPDCEFSYIFKNCLLNTPKVEGVESIIDCMFEDKKDFDYDAQETKTRQAGNFYPAFDTDQLVYPFTLHPASRAVNAADATLTLQSTYTTDLKGRSRMADDGPDIGAYEAQPIEENGTTTTK